ncbi:hypothetical protein [Azospirillum argentinense]|uniref:hypothetical protein n=1 Tax=Azospirillum argentinense TaxID=2970906 RepID=UPI0032DF95D5
MSDKTEKFTAFGTIPDAYQSELLTIAGEECNEVAVRISKMQRFGIDEVEPGQLNTNAARLSMEIGNLQCMIDELVDEGLVDREWVSIGYHEKADKLPRFMRNTKVRS